MNTQILYLEAEKRNFIDKFLIHNPGYFQRPEDGKLDYLKRTDPNTPWIHTCHSPNQMCLFWHVVLFDKLYHRTKVPIPCQECWKVVVAPRSLDELIAMYLMQRKLNVPSKCGLETARANSDKPYGAYFYNRSLEEGKKCYARIKAEIEKGEIYEGQILGAPIKAGFMLEGEIPMKQGKLLVEGPPSIILKRGCTEMEQACGRSDKWSYDEDQVEFEEFAKDAFVLDFPNIRQSDYQLAKIFQSWIHAAYQYGDETYLKFTNGNRLFDPPVIYHKED